MLVNYLVNYFGNYLVRVLDHIYVCTFCEKCRVFESCQTWSAVNRWLHVYPLTNPVEEYLPFSGYGLRSDQAVLQML